MQNQISLYFNRSRTERTETQSFKTIAYDKNSAIRYQKCIL